MAETSSAWHVEREPVRKYAFFLSHVAENKEFIKRVKKYLVSQVEEAGRTIDCFLDVHNWPKAHDLMAVIKNALFNSEFTAVWITPEYLRNRRGWVWIELGFSDLIEVSQNLGSHGVQYPFIVPMFCGVTTRQIERTPWLNYWQRGIHFEKEATAKSVALQLTRFYLEQASDREKLK